MNGRKLASLVYGNKKVELKENSFVKLPVINRVTKEVVIVVENLRFKKGGMMVRRA